jgi:hypothetical protein
MRILRDTPVPVIPIALVGLWGSMFSRYGRKLWQRMPRKLWHRVAVNVGGDFPPEAVEPEGLREEVLKLYAGGAA